MTKELAMYNGKQMVVEWPAPIEAAQKIHEYVICGIPYARIRYGDEIEVVMCLR